MRRPLRDLEQEFRDGRISRREFHRRAAWLAGGIAAAGFVECVAPRAALAASSITLDPTVDPLAQGYSTEGTAPYTPGSRLRIDDGSTIDRRLFYKVVPEIESGPVTIETDLQIDPSSVTTDGEDTGVHIVLNGGANVGTEIRLACILRNGQRRMAFRTADGTFDNGLPVDWSALVPFRFEKRANGDGVLTILGGDTMVNDAAAQPPAKRIDPTFEIGCFSTAARASVTFGPIGLQPQPFPIAIVPSRCDLFPNASEKVHVEGLFTLDAASPGIDPVADKVALRLLRADGSRIYPVTTDFMPLPFAELPLGTGWALTDAAKQATGIQDFSILKTANPRFFTYKLVDARTNIPQANYAQTTVELIIGDDRGSLEMTLLQTLNGNWGLA